MTSFSSDMAVLAAAIRELPLAPDTVDGARQRWVRENAARLAEGKQPLPWHDPVTHGPPREPSYDRLTDHEHAMEALADAIHGLEVRLARVEREGGRT